MNKLKLEKYPIKSSIMNFPSITRKSIFGQGKSFPLPCQGNPITKLNPNPNRNLKQFLTLRIEKFKNPTHNSEVESFVVKFETSNGRNMSHTKNFDEEKSYQSIDKGHKWMQQLLHCNDVLIVSKATNLITNL